MTSTQKTTRRRPRSAPAEQAEPGGEQVSPRVTLAFTYLTGIRRDVFRNVRLAGSWAIDGSYSDVWTVQPMEQITGEDGCPALRAEVELERASLDRMRWGVIVDAPRSPNAWGIPAEPAADFATPGPRTLAITGDSEQRFYLTHCRRFGANKHVTPAGTGIRFSVWAPNAQSVELVMGDPDRGYIGDDGSGVTATFPMAPEGDGVWSVDEAAAAPLGSFADFDHRPYMFRITNEQGNVVYRTDLYSRCQIGRGTVDPASLPGGPASFTGGRAEVDGTVSCSVVVDPERVTEHFSEPVWPERDWLTEEEFWAAEFDPLRPVPARVEDLVIYELHVGGLGAGNAEPDGTPIPGTLADAIAHLDYLVDLGVNAIEVMPMNEFEGWASWGYGSSHYLAVEYSGGGRDQFKHFVRECHRRGIAVILDVVYNHFHHNATRAEWAYDSEAPERNVYYWYEGSPADYADPSGGYIDNESTGYAPRFWDRNVRQLFISSAVALATEFHVDGFRVDQTTSIHSYARLHADGRQAGRANSAGASFLREWTRTLRLVKPDVMLMAEDHSGWDAVTRPVDLDGLGFNATWYADFYHHLIGDGNHGSSYAKLLSTAGSGGDEPLAMSYFAGALAASSARKVVYHESHDEAGNAANSARTIVVAVNRAPLEGETRRYAEARARVAAGLSLLSAGTPMFFMGEEVGAANDYRYDDFAHHREDYEVLRAASGAALYRFYQDLLRLRRAHSAFSSRHVDVLHVHDANRFIAFRRTDGHDDVVVMATLANRPWSNGYAVASPGLGDATWHEVFNSDSAEYGGSNTGNLGGALESRGGTLSAVVPANGFVVFARA